MSDIEKHKAEEGRKFDSEKLRWDLLLFREVEQVVEILTLGARKYAAFNWQFVENARERYIAAGWRHFVAYSKGEKLDSESKRSHLAHLICCALFLMWFDNEDAKIAKEHENEIPF